MKINHEVLEIPNITDHQDFEVIGYQYRTDGSFAGELRFINNQDKSEIHLPHSTTLIAPPDLIPHGMSLFWDENRNSWLLINTPIDETETADIMNANELIQAEIKEIELQLQEQVNE